MNRIRLTSSVGSTLLLVGLAGCTGLNATSVLKPPSQTSTTSTSPTPGLSIPTTWTSLTAVASDSTQPLTLSVPGANSPFSVTLPVGAVASLTQTFGGAVTVSVTPTTASDLSSMSNYLSSTVGGGQALGGLTLDFSKYSAQSVQALRTQATGYPVPIRFYYMPPTPSMAIPAGTVDAYLTTDGTSYTNVGELNITSDMPQLISGTLNLPFTTARMTIIFVARQGASASPTPTPTPNPTPTPAPSASPLSLPVTLITSSGATVAEADVLVSGPLLSGDIMAMHMVNQVGQTYDYTYTVASTDSLSTAIAAFTMVMNYDGVFANDYMANPITGGFNVQAYAPGSGYDISTMSVTVTPPVDVSSPTPSPSPSGTNSGSSVNTGISVTNGNVVHSGPLTIN